MKLKTCPANIYKVLCFRRFIRSKTLLNWLDLVFLYGNMCHALFLLLSYCLLQELWLASHLINEFGDESSIMTVDGAFSGAWLKNLKRPIGSLIFTHENETRNSSDAFQFSAQPSSIPGSVLQLLGSSYLIRASSWEMYGRWSIWGPLSYYYFKLDIILRFLRPVECLFIWVCLYPSYICMCFA